MANRNCEMPRGIFTLGHTHGFFANYWKKRKQCFVKRLNVQNRYINIKIRIILHIYALQVICSSDDELNQQSRFSFIESVICRTRFFFVCEKKSSINVQIDNPTHQSKYFLYFYCFAVPLKPKREKKPFPYEMRQWIIEIYRLLSNARKFVSTNTSGCIKRMKSNIWYACVHTYVYAFFFVVVCRIQHFYQEQTLL